MTIWGFLEDCLLIQSFIDLRWINIKKHQQTDLKLKKFFKSKDLRKWEGILKDKSLKMKGDSNMKNGLKIKSERFLQQSYEIKQTQDMWLRGRVWYNPWWDKIQLPQWWHIHPWFIRTKMWLQHLQPQTQQDQWGMETIWRTTTFLLLHTQGKACSLRNKLSSTQSLHKFNPEFQTFEAKLIINSFSSSFSSILWALPKSTFS